MAKISKELEEEIKHSLTQKEKDKLLLRLIRKEPLLIMELDYRLMLTEEEREIYYERHREYIEISYRYSNTLGWAWDAMRSNNGDITRYKRISKDKLGTTKLVVFMLNTFFRDCEDLLDTEYRKKKQFAEYIVKRVSTVLKDLEKINEDYYMEITDEVNELLKYVFDYEATRSFAETYNLPRRWYD